VSTTINRSEKSAASANFSEGGRASQRLNKPRTVPKSPTELGNARAACSRKVHRGKLGSGASWLFTKQAEPTTSQSDIRSMFAVISATADD
jgi:hypothetical protein